VKDLLPTLKPEYVDAIQSEYAQNLRILLDE
jgi:hypothetical protein